MTLGRWGIPVKSYRPETIFANSPLYIPCNTAELRWGTFPTCYDDFENCSEQPKTNKMGINTAPITFLTFGFSHWSLAPPNDDKREKKKVLFEMKLPIIEGAKEGEK